MTTTDMSFENRQVLNIVQALVGAVTPNLRRVAIEASPGTVRLYFLLEREDAQDREEIEDVVFEFEALQNSNVQIDVEVCVDARPVDTIDFPRRAVYGRKEDAP